MFSLKKKDSLGQITGQLFVYAPMCQLRAHKSLQVLTLSPRFFVGLPPDPGAFTSPANTTWLICQKVKLKAVVVNRR